MKQALENAIMAYVKEFEKKHNVTFECWIGVPEIGSIACFDNEISIEFNDLRFDIDENAPLGLIEEWYWDANHINYYSYIKGFRG